MLSATLSPRIRGRYLEKCSSVTTTSNLFKVDFSEETKVYIYHVKCNPEITADNTKKFRKIIVNYRKVIERLVGTFAVSGRTIFGTKLQQKGKMDKDDVNFKIDFEGTNYQFKMKVVKEVSMSDISSTDKKKSGIVFAFLNNLIKNFFHQIDYTEIGKSSKYFDAHHFHELQSARVTIFRGYSSSFKLLEDGLFLRMDPAVKIVRNESVLEVINRVYSSCGALSKQEKRLKVEAELVNKQVMANYGKHMYYVIDSVLFDVPLDNYTFFNGKEEIKLVDYYRKTYDIKLSSPRQPLLKASLSKKDKEKEKEVILIPELLQLTGLPENFDERKRREVSDQTIVSPSHKMNELSEVFEKFNTDKDGFNPNVVSEKLGIKLDTRPASIEAKQFHLPELQLGKRDKIEDHKATCFNLFNKPLFNTNIHMKIGVLSPSDFDLSQIKTLMDSTCRNLGLHYELACFPTNFNQGRRTLQNIEATVDKEVNKHNGCNVFWFILPNNFKNNYGNLKKLMLRIGIEKSSQVSLMSTMQKKGFNSVFTKILLQMAAKVGNKLWVPKVSSKIATNGVMMIGIENYGDSSDSSNNILSYCCNTDRQCSQFYSNYTVHKKHENKTHMNEIFYNCLMEYIKVNNEGPREIILIKNGSTKYDNSMKINVEVEEIKTVLKSSKDTMNSKLMYVLLDKDTNQKFFSQRGNDVVNPSSGLLVNSHAVSQDFEFYLVAQQCNRGTVKPTFYKVVYNNSSMEQGLVEELLYGQCFNYMNWTGSIKVPSVMQYAKKLSMFIGQYVGTSKVGENMTDKLYYI